MPAEVTLLKISASKRGDASELLVSADLVIRGWSVFRSVCRHAPFDLVIYKAEGGLLGVEVRTSNKDLRKHDGEPSGFSTKCHANIMAVVCGDDIFYYRVEEGQLVKCGNLDTLCKSVTGVEITHTGSKIAVLSLSNT